MIIKVIKNNYYQASLGLNIIIKGMKKDRNNDYQTSPRHDNS